MTIDFRNPLNFRCRPNETDPCYAIEHDLERFIAFGLVQCHDHLLLGKGAEKIDATPEDVYWLRKHFLATVFMLIDWYPIAVERAFAPQSQKMRTEEQGEAIYDGDLDEGSIHVALKGKNREDDALNFRWVIDTYQAAKDNAPACFMLDLDWGEDSTYVWVKADLFENREAAEAVIKKAEEVNEKNRTDAIWSKVNA